MIRTFVGAQVRALAAAITFMTRLPLGRYSVHDATHLPASVVYFPIVGVVVALGGATVYAAAQHMWPHLVAVPLSMVSTIMMTGAFHEDALADALDGFGGGWTPERVLAIMKDSRVGSYALVGVALTLAIKAATLVTIADRGGTSAIARALVAGHVLGRWSSVPLIWQTPYVRSAMESERPSAGRPFTPGVSVGNFVGATAIAFLVIVLVLSPIETAVCASFATLVTVFCRRYSIRRIGGITGDTLGATNQLVEVCVYLYLSA